MNNTTDHLRRHAGNYVRVSLYFLIACLTPISSALAAWVAEGRAPDEIGVLEWRSVVIGALLAGLVAVRAYFDQHLSRTEPATPNPDPNEKTPHTP